MKKELVCTGCPIGCRMDIEIDNGVVSSVSGNQCRRGKDYARQEAVIPLRVLTGNMKARGCSRPFSVMTDRPIPKDILLACALELKKHRPALPIVMGDVVIEDILGTGSNIIATQDLKDQSPISTGKEAT